MLYRQVYGGKDRVFGCQGRTMGGPIVLLYSLCQLHLASVCVDLASSLDSSVETSRKILDEGGSVTYTS